MPFFDLMIIINLLFPYSFVLLLYLKLIRYKLELITMIIFTSFRIFS